MLILHVADGSVPSRTDGGASGNGDDATVDVLAQRRSSGDGKLYKSCYLNISDVLLYIYTGLSDVQSRRSQSEQISTLAESEYNIF